MGLESMPLEDRLEGISGPGALLSKILAQREDAEKAERARVLISQISQAKSREQALEIAALAAAQAKNTKDLTFTYGLVDQYHPRGDETPQEIDVLTADNKREKKFVKRGDLTKLNDPANVEQMFGKGARIQQPEQEYDFLRPGFTVPASPETGEEAEIPTQSTGRGPLSLRPRGSVTTQEFTVQRQQEDDRLQREAAARAERRLALSEDRMSRILGRLSDRDGDRVADNFRADVKTGESILARGLGKALTDGSFDFDNDDKKEVIFNKRLAFFGELLEQDYTKRPNAKFRNVGAMADKAIKAFPTSRDLDGDKPEPDMKVVKTKKIGDIEYYHYGEKDEKGNPVWYSTKQKAKKKK